MYSERRANGEVVHVEVGHGVGIAVAGWMLDEAPCATFTLGPPCASVTALAELHRLLVEHGHRRSSLGVHHTVGEASHENRFESSSSASQAAFADRSASAVHDVRGARASFLGYNPIVLSSASQSRGTAADQALKRLAVAGLASHPICTQAK